MFPSDESSLRQWVYNPRLIRNKLHFTLRFCSVASLRHIHDSVYPWMMKNTSFVKMDFLSSMEVVGIGCIVECHTQYYNRDDI